MEKEHLFYKYFVDAFKLDLRTILNTVKTAMHEVFNMDKFYQADIFIHESNLHIIMLQLFKEMNIKTINVYDGFYFVNDTMNQDLYNTIYDKATNMLLEHYKVKEEGILAA